MIELFKTAITILFLSFFAVCDLKKREVENGPIFILFLISVGFLVINFHETTWTEYVFTLIWLVVVTALYFMKFYGGADFKILFVLCILFPLSFIQIFAGSLIFSMIYVAAAKIKIFQKWLELEKGIPFLLPVFVSFSFLVLSNTI